MAIRTVVCLCLLQTAVETARVYHYKEADDVIGTNDSFDHLAEHNESIIFAAEGVPGSHDHSGAPNLKFASSEARGVASETVAKLSLVQGSVRSFAIGQRLASVGLRFDAMWFTSSLLGVLVGVGALYWCMVTMASSPECDDNGRAPKRTDRATFFCRKTGRGTKAVFNPRNMEFARQVSMEVNASHMFNFWMLDEDWFDEPKGQENWMQRRFWIDRRGVLNYWNNDEERVISTFNIVCISELEILRLPAHETCFKHACSVGFKPSANPEDDVLPTYLAAEEETDMQDLFKCYAHFQKVESAKATALFICNIKYRQVVANEPEVKSWQDIDMWIDERGLACYSDAKTLEIGELMDGESVCNWTAEMQPKDESSKLYIVQVQVDGKPTAIFASEHQDAISALSETCDDLENDASGCWRSQT